jgi:HK97 family phage major capsid protein
MTALKELRARRGQIVTQMRGMLDLASAEKRDLTAEEKAKYDTLFNEQEQVGLDVAREERQLELDRRMAEMAAAREGQQENSEQQREDRTSPRASGEYRAAFARFLRGGVNVLAGEELRALQAGADVDGGYLVAPQQFVTELIKAVADQVAIRQLARTVQGAAGGFVGCSLARC